MFARLAERLGEALGRLRGRGRLDPREVEECLRQVRLALLEADVHFRVARDFVEKVRERVSREAPLSSLSPHQQVLRWVYEELVALLGPEEPLRLPSHRPGVVFLCGLQGAGKTTTAAKLGLYFARRGQKALLLALDRRRPAAQEQLSVLAQRLNLPCRGFEALEEGVESLARRLGCGVVIADTAGRWQVDRELMAELAFLKERLKPDEALLVVDAMTGQQALSVALEFHRQVGLTGAILTKAEGDARGGAALSLRAVTGCPIKFLGVGEKVEELDPFRPERLARRILGMGDLEGMVEKVQEVVRPEEAVRLARGQFTLEDFRDQLRRFQSFGPLGELFQLFPRGRKTVPWGEIGEKGMRRALAIIDSMTPEERRDPEILNASRRRRIARGSGTSVEEVNRLLRAYEEVQRLVKSMRGKGRRW